MIPPLSSQPLSPVPEGAISTDLPPPSSPRDHHSMGLLALANGDVWATIQAVNRAAQDQHAAAHEQGGEEEPVDVGGGWSVGPAGRGVPLAMAVRFATRDDIESALRDEKPPLVRPDMPLRPVNELDVPKSYTEMLRNEHSGLFRDAMKREVFGLLEAKTFRVVDM